MVSLLGRELELAPREPVSGKGKKMVVIMSRCGGIFSALRKSIKKSLQVIEAAMTGASQRSTSRVSYSFQNVHRAQKLFIADDS
jgi:hypothetical protein